MQTIAYKITCISQQFSSITLHVNNDFPKSTTTAGSILLQIWIFIPHCTNLLQTEHFSSMISKSFSCSLPPLVLISRGSSKFLQPNFLLLDLQHFRTERWWLWATTLHQKPTVPDNVKTLVTMTTRENRQSTYRSLRTRQSSKTHRTTKQLPEQREKRARASQVELETNPKLLSTERREQHIEVGIHESGWLWRLAMGRIQKAFFLAQGIGSSKSPTAPLSSVRRDRAWYVQGDVRACVRFQSYMRP